MIEEDKLFDKNASELCNSDEMLEELKAAAFEVLLLNPDANRVDQEYTR